MPIKVIEPRAGYSHNYRLRGTVRAGKAKRRVNQTAGTADFKRAHEIRARLEAEILDELIHGKRPSRFFDEAAAEYAATLSPRSTQQIAIAGVIRRDGKITPCLAEDFRGWPIEKIDQGAVDALIKRRFQGKAPATIDRNLLTPLLGVLNWAARRGWCPPPAFERPSYRNAPRRPATTDELDRLADAASAHFLPLFLCLALTGMRLSEALKLDWADVDLGRRWLVLRNTKRGKRGPDKPGEDRGVPIHPQLLMALANMPAPREGRVFLTDPHSPGQGRPYREADGQGGGSQIKTVWRRTCARVGVTDLTVHGLRHTVATQLKELRVWEEYRQQILGHARHAMTERYEHGEAEIVRPELLEAIDQLPWIGAKGVQQVLGVAKL